MYVNVYVCMYVNLYAEIIFGHIAKQLRIVLYL